MPKRLTFREVLAARETQPRIFWIGLALYLLTIAFAVICMVGITTAMMTYLDPVFSGLALYLAGYSVGRKKTD